MPHPNSCLCPSSWHMEEGKNPHGNEANKEKRLPEKLSKRDKFLMELFELLNPDRVALYVTVPWPPQGGQWALIPRC